MIMKKALITGILGQDGPYLAKFLLKKGYKVYGLIQKRANHNFSNTEYLNVTSKIKFVQGDIIKRFSVQKSLFIIQFSQYYKKGSTG